MDLKYILLIMGLVLLVGTASAEGEPTIEGHTYFQEIEYSGCDQAVYQQDLVIHRSEGTAYEETSNGLKIWHLYTGTNCQEDYDDLRFTNSTGSELAYYLWPDYNSTYAQVCVRLEGADAAGAVTAHYGNSTATTTSNGSATYGFFDDYSDSATLTDYTELHYAPWSGLKYKEIANGRLHLGWDGSGYGSALLYADCPLSSGQFRVEAGFQATGTVTSYRHQKEIGLTTPTTPSYYDSTCSSGAEFSGFGGTIIAMPGDTGQTAPAGSIGHAEYTLDSTTRYPGVWLQDISSTTDASEIWIDHILVRAYSATPPAATAFLTGPAPEIPPVAGFSGSPTSGTAPLTVQFTDTSTGAPTSWAWTFGDGATSTAQSPAHTYAAAGTYTVALTATNSYGADLETKESYIVVMGPPGNPEDYQYTKVYSINGSNDGSLDNYPIRITLHNTTGADNGSDVYLGSGIVQPDYDDVVFSDQYGALIPHGYMSFTGSSAETWVRVPFIPAGSESQISIYIHYGNATLAGRDSLHDVFQLYEPWDGNTPNYVPTVSDVAISTEAGKYEAWPGIARDPDTGTMWVIYRTSDSNTHAFDSTGRVVVRKSEDDGATWGPEVIVSDIPGVDDRNAVISWVDNDGVGTLIAAYVTYASNGASQYTFVKTSTDGGVTWGPAIPVQAGQARTPYGPCGMNSQGDLWICTYSLNSVFYDVSADGGETWAEYVVSNGYGSETAIIETKTNGVYSGGMLAVIRDDSSPCSYYITRSSDYGCTWDAVTQTGVFPSPYPTPVYLFRTSDDYILLAYTDTSLNLRIYQSYDEGLHWDYKGIVVSGQSISYYPAIAQINDSTLYVIWCTNDDGSDVYGNYVDYPLRAQWAIPGTPPPIWR